MENVKVKKAARSLDDVLYPLFSTNTTGYLKVSEFHSIYFEVSGNPNGKPAVFLHGGPGGGTEAKMRRFFDPQKYRIVLFDQRGCGKSRPHADLRENTTWHLVNDIEALRRHLGIDRWLVFGGSWGSTLALAYAEKHPERVTELVLRGIFLLRRSEIDWFYQNPEGAGSIYPDLWERFVAPIPPSERKDMVGAYYKRLISRARVTRDRAALAWSTWEARASYLQTNSRAISKCGDLDRANAIARIECHYFINRGFFRADNQLINNVGKIRRIPTVIVQGRYDMVCPMRSAWDLHRASPHTELRVVESAGHASFEPAIARELIRATDRFACR